MNMGNHPLFSMLIPTVRQGGLFGSRNWKFKKNFILWEWKAKYSLLLSCTVEYLEMQLKQIPLWWLQAASSCCWSFWCCQCKSGQHPTSYLQQPLHATLAYMVQNHHQKVEGNEILKKLYLSLRWIDVLWFNTLQFALPSHLTRSTMFLGDVSNISHDSITIHSRT